MKISQNALNNDGMRKDVMLNSVPVMLISNRGMGCDIESLHVVDVCLNIPVHVFHSFDPPPRPSLWHHYIVLVCVCVHVVIILWNVILFKHSIACQIINSI